MRKQYCLQPFSAPCICEHICLLANRIRYHYNVGCCMLFFSRSFFNELLRWYGKIKMKTKSAFFFSFVFVLCAYGRAFWLWHLYGLNVPTAFFQKKKKKATHIYISTSGCISANEYHITFSGRKWNLVQTQFCNENSSKTTIFMILQQIILCTIALE